MLKQKSDAFKTLKKWKVLVEKQIKKKIKHLHANNGMEFYSNGKFYRDENIFRNRTVRETPQQNKVAKGMNMTLLEQAQCRLSNTKLPNSFWSEAIKHDGLFDKSLSCNSHRLHNSE